MAKATKTKLHRIETTTAYPKDSQGDPFERAVQHTRNAMLDALTQEMNAYKNLGEMDDPGIYAYRAALHHTRAAVELALKAMAD